MADNRLQTLIKIRNGLELILGVDGGNYLGVYEVLKNGIVATTIPAIKIRYPMKIDNMNTRMKTNSGIECTIESEPQVINKPIKFGYNFHKYYQIILDQHAELGDLLSSVELIISSNFFDIPESPVIRSAIKQESGIIPPRALLFIRHANYSANILG
jgi:hypothetical protein